MYVLHCADLAEICGHLGDIYRVYRTSTGYLQYRASAGHLRDIYRTYTGHLQYICRTCTGHLRNTHRTSAGHLQDIYKTYTGHLQDIYNTFKAHLKCICQKEFLQKTNIFTIKFLWKMYSLRCADLAGIWGHLGNIYNTSTGHLQNIHRTFTGHLQCICLMEFLQKTNFSTIKFLSKMHSLHCADLAEIWEHLL